MICKDTHALQAEITEEIPVIRKLCAVVHIIITGAEKHSSLLQRFRRSRIQFRIKSVYCAFQLTADSVVILGL